MKEYLKGKKTYVNALMAIAAAWIAYAYDGVDLAATITATFAAIATMTIRAAITTEAAKAKEEEVDPYNVK